VDGDDSQYMQQALQLAASVRGRTAPNPAVGAVIVREGQIVGRGATRPPSGSHAEVIALEDAGDEASGATMFVTLEPCCHYGRTPPCTDALIRTRIARCVIAMEDPFPAVAGGGIARLREAGIKVEVGLGHREAAVINAGWLHRLAVRRPLVTAKYAMTLDGRIATHTGDSRWVTGEVARHVVHRLRDTADAIMVGSGTVLADDPALTTRLPAEDAGDGGPHHPLRVIVDGRGVCPSHARVFSPDLPGRTLVATTPAAPPGWREELLRQGVEVLDVGAQPRVDLAALMTCLGNRGVSELLVEGGGRLHGALFDQSLIDRVAAFIAPVLVGGEGSVTPIGGMGIKAMANAWRLDQVSIKRLGVDLLVEGTVVRADEEAA
jgi:diaminohydroxyphosphoribosylaminopyrimidine deaminase/5-amino-6-(5-phosphoribosylamino)uracil reductase